MMADKEDKQFRNGPIRSPGKNTAFQTLAAHIPSGHIVCFGKLLGRLIYLLDIPHRRIVRRNLRFAYPDWPQEHIQAISERTFQNIGITITEIFQAASFSCDDLLGKISIRGEGHIENALKLNRGLILVSAHLGNWEVGLQFLSCYMQMPITGVAKRIRYEPLNRRLNALRTRFGLKIINKKGALPQMRQALRRGEVMGLLIDQSKRSESVDVRFFGHTVTAPSAAAMLALRCKSPVVPIFCVREAGYKLAFYAEPPLEIKRTHDLRSDLATNTQMMTDIIEKMIRKYPDQWLWLHKRWKKHYPHLYPEFFARRQRRKERERREILKR